MNISRAEVLMDGITVGKFLDEKSEDLSLELIAGVDGLSRIIKVFDVNRPGLALTNYFEHFPAERIQIIGLGEYSYLSKLTPGNQAKVLEKLFSYKEMPCFIIARGLEPLEEMISIHQKYKIPLIKTSMTTSQLMSELISYLEEKMAPSVSVHGVLLDVFGLGVLLSGDAGIGKSECALELVKTGHMLVADDVVEIKQRSGGVLMGRGMDIIKHHMELRGLGIVDINSLFGAGNILDKIRVEIVVKLEDWNPKEEYERVGLEEQYTTIMGVRIPEIIIPVKPGRNLATLVEVASLNQQLKKRGLYSAKELNKRLIKIMSNKD